MPISRIWQFGIYHLRRGGSIGVGGRVGVSVGVVVAVAGEPRRHSTAALELPAAAAARRAAGRRARAVPLVYHEVDRHFALQTADVAVAKVIAEFVYLKKTKGIYH